MIVVSEKRCQASKNKLKLEKKDTDSMKDEAERYSNQSYIMFFDLLSQRKKKV